MLQSQKKYIKYINELENELNKVKVNSKVKKNFKFKELKNIIEETELLIPIIGAFSSGKSSLINSFLGKSYLPVNLTPETALATELRYSDKEYIEAIKDDTSVEKFAIDEINKITKVSHKFKFLKMYISNEKLKEIEPLVLVDMPGFESPLDLHNRAIMEYINRGVYYIVLTSVEDGIITRSMIRQLTDIQEYGRDFSFFLSKTNLRAKSESTDIAKKVQEQIEELFDIEKEIILVDNNGGKNLEKILSIVNPEELFENLFLTSLKDNYFNIIEIINTTISSLGNDKNKNKILINELKESFQKLEIERDSLISEASERYSNNNVNRIVESVGKELSNSLDEIVSLAINGDEDNVSHLILEIMRHTLVINLKISMNNISNNVVDSLSHNLLSLNRSMSEITMSDNWLEKITDTTKIMLTSTKSGIDNMIYNRQQSNNTDKFYKTITTILATTTTVLIPIIELIIIFLPELFGGLFEQYQQRKQKEKIRDIILTQTIPSLKRELRSHLPKIFNQQVQEMIKDISSQFEGTLEEKKFTVEATQKDIEEKTINIEETINSYKKVNSNITTLANKILYNSENKR